MSSFGDLAAHIVLLCLFPRGGVDGLQGCWSRWTPMPVSMVSPAGHCVCCELINIIYIHWWYLGTLAALGEHNWSIFSLHVTDTGLPVYCIATQEGVQEVLLHFLVYGFHDNMHVYVLCFWSSTALRCLTWRGFYCFFQLRALASSWIQQEHQKP